MCKVLLVEDEANQRLLYGQELKDEGYQVVEAADGKEAMAKLDQSNPDIVILDISMPGMDGIEALGRILSRDNTTPVIIHTAYANYKDNFMTWSADAYVVKSSDLTELKTTIRSVLEKKARDQN